jgi:hypothetical protein
MLNLLPVRHVSRTWLPLSLRQVNSTKWSYRPTHCLPGNDLWVAVFGSCSVRPCVSVLCCAVCVQVLRRADPPRKVSYRRSVRSVISEVNSESTQTFESELERRVSQSVNKSVGQSVGRSISQSVNQSVGRSVSRPVIRSVSQSISQSVYQSVGQSFGQ